MWPIDAGFDVARLKPAVRLFELNTELFPEAFNAWDSLGEAFLESGKENKALGCYQKSLELNPDNTNAEKMIARIEGGKEQRN